MIVKVFRSIDELEREEINSLAVDDAFFTYEWFKILESQRSFPNSPFYFAVYDEGDLVAFTPCFVDWTNIYFGVGPRLRFIKPFIQKMVFFGQKHGFCRGNVLLCYSPSCGRSKVLQTPGVKRELVLKLLADKIDEVCRKERFLFSSFHFVSEFDENLISVLRRASYQGFSGITNFYLDINWSTFEAYLKSLTRNHRKNVLRKIRRCAANGVLIEKQDFGSFSMDKLSWLLHNLNLKYNKSAKNVMTPRFFENIREFASHKITLFVARKNSEVVGFSLLFRQGETVDSWMCGFDYDALDRKDYVYFNLVYNATIQWAIREGVKKINYRSTAESAKLIWGCEPEKTLSFVKCHDSLLGPVINNTLRAPFSSYLSQWGLSKEL